MDDDLGENQFLPNKKAQEELYFLGQGTFRMKLEIVGEDETVTKNPEICRNPPPSPPPDSASKGGGFPETQVPNLAESLQQGWLVTARRDRRVPAAAFSAAPAASAVTTVATAEEHQNQNPNPKRGAEEDEATSSRNESKNRRINEDSPVDEQLKNLAGGESIGKTPPETQKNGEENPKDEHSKSSKSDQRKKKCYDRRVPKEEVIMHFKYDREGGSEIIRVRNKKRTIKELESKSADHPRDNQYKCRICARVFGSFQALGGHISRHTKGNNSAEGKAPVAREGGHECPKPVALFDLNELPPMEDEGEGDQDQPLG